MSLVSQKRRPFKADIIRGSWFKQLESGYEIMGMLFCHTVHW